MRIVAALCVCLLAVTAQPLVQTDAWGTDAIRVRIAPPGGSIVSPPLQALMSDTPPPAEPGSPFVRTSTGIQNGNLLVTVDAATGFITATRVSDGVVLLMTTALSFGAATLGSRPGSVNASISFAGHGPSERIYGMGEHRTGSVQVLPFYQNMQESQDYGISHGSDSLIPYYGSSLGYGFLWNLPSYGTVNLTADVLTWSSNATLNVDFWICSTTAGLDYTTTSPYGDLLRKMVDVVGHAPTMPYYSTGFIQCKDRYRNQSQLMAVAQGYVERGLPISVIVIDWKHWVNQGDWTFDPACWPDPQAMYDNLQAMGIELMTTFWPFQTTPSKHWAEFSSGNYLATNLTGSQLPFDGNQYVYDATNPAARNATFRGFVEGYNTYGIKTIWLDAAEPERFGEQGFGDWQFQLGTDAEIGMAWTQQHVRTFADGFASVGIAPSDYFVLPRHVWAGSWRYSAAMWSGDIQSSFAELELQVRVLQGTVLSGQPLWTTDIGGYWGGNLSDPVFQELIVRWFQFGAFCPLFRLHGHRDGGPPSNECGGTNGDNEVWELAPDPIHYAGIVAVMNLRENLRSYVADINAITAETGFPMVRPMVLAYPSDPVCATPSLEGQYMFGDDWLVAPVTTYQATSWPTYLPALPSNETWVYWWNQTALNSSVAQWVNVDVSDVRDFPLFFRSFITPPPPPDYSNITSYWSPTRLDVVTCLDPSCFNNNVGMDDYSILGTEGVGVIAAGPGSVSLNGTLYSLVPLNLFFSPKYADNYEALNATPPDATYTVSFPDGYVLPNAVQGFTTPLEVYLRTWNASKVDYATLAAQSSIQWAIQNGYTYQFTAGHALLLAPTGA